MVAWFIIAIATLAIFAFIAINGVQTVASTTDSIGRVETARRLDTAVAALIARSGSPNNSGNMMVLAGQTVDGVYGLPGELSAYSTTAFGQRIVYCPFGDGESGTTTVQVPSGGGNTYPIQTRADPNGRIYVTSGRPSFPQVADNPNLMGYLIAPRTKTSETPTCSSVRYNVSTKRFEAPNALVRPIIRETSSEERREAAGREVVYYVSTTGTGRGTSTGDRASLYDALTYYRSAQPSSMRIIMADGNYVLPQHFMDHTQGGFSDKGSSPSLLIEGNGANLDFQATSNVWMPGHLQLRDLTITNSAGIYVSQDQSVSLNNTSTGFLYVHNGGSLTGTNVAVTDTRLTVAIYALNGSKIVLNGTVNIAGAVSNGQHVYSDHGSSISIQNANVTMRTISGSTYIGLYSGMNSSLAVSNSNLNFQSAPSFPMLVHGDTSLSGTNVNFSAAVSRGVEIQRNGTFAMLGGTFGGGNAPTNAIHDYGTATVTGTGTVRARNNCWVSSTSNGNQFTYSNNGNGASSSVTADETLPALSPAPTSAELAAHSAVQARNTMRAQVRATNTSNFTCQIG